MPNKCVNVWWSEPHESVSVQRKIKPSPGHTCPPFWRIHSDSAVKESAGTSASAWDEMRHAWSNKTTAQVAIVLSIAHCLMPGLPKLSKSFLCMKPGRSTHHCLSIYPLVISRLERLDNRVQHHAKSWRRYLSQVSLNSCTVPFWQHLRIFKLVSRQPARSACLRVNGQISSIYVIFVGKWAYKNTGQFAKNLDIYFNQNTLYCWTLPFS